MDETSDEMAMQRLANGMGARCLADAHKEVLDTYELLQQILLQRPIKDLFVLQRTCGKWRKIITESHALQKRMYLRPQAAVMKPLLKGTMMSYTGPVKINSALAFQLRHHVNNQRLECHMLTSQHRSFGHASITHGHDYNTTSATFRVLKHAFHSPRLPPAFGSYREEASWKQMLITNRPISGARVYVYDVLDDDDDDRHLTIGILSEQVTVYNRSGVTFGDLVDVRRMLKDRLRQAGNDEAAFEFKPVLHLKDAEMFNTQCLCKGEYYEDCKGLERLEMT